MDENIIENSTTPSTNKFIFADAFYNSLGATNIESQDDKTESTELTSNNLETTVVDNNSFQEVETNENESNTTPEQPEGVNNTFNSMDFLISNAKQEDSKKEENNSILTDDSLLEPNIENNIDNNIEINEENNFNNDDISDSKFDDFYEKDNSEKDPFSANFDEFENKVDNKEEEKAKFTQFLLGKEANYKPFEQQQLVPTPKDETTSYDGPVDESLNVQTGIDKNLENFLFSRRTIAEEEKEDEYAEYRKNIEPEEKTVYRAARRKREVPINKELISSEPISTFPEFNTQVNNIDSNLNDVPIDFDKMKINSIHTPEIDEDDDWEPDDKPQPIVITEEIDYNEPTEYENEEVVISTLLDELREKSKETGKISILAKYGDDFCSHNYITNPAIGRDREIKELGLILLTPEKSAILVGKPGIGKTSIVEGLAFRIQRNRVPDALKGYRIVSVKTTSLLGTLPTGETRLQTLIDEIKDLDKIILFVDEVHMLMGATNESSLDFANMFKESLGRGTIKMIGATTSDEYERYVLRDKAFVRRFQRVDVAEPTKDQTVEILMGTLPKIEKNTGAKLKYTHYLQVELMTFIVDITSEYKRVYGIGSRYPDICITLVSQAFSEAVFDNRSEVNVLDIRNAIEHSKNIYPDVISKELINFDEKFRDLIKQEKGE